MHRPISPLFLGICLCFSSFPTSALATQVLRTSAEEMAQRSDVILHAHVVDQRVEWNSARSRILTLTTLRVEEAIKGKVGNTIEVYQVGGTLDGVTYNIPGALKFAKGEEIIFFGVRFRERVASYGMGLGKYEVTRTEKEASVAPSYGDVEFVSHDSIGRLGPAPEQPEPSVPLKAFTARIRAALQGGVK